MRQILGRELVVGARPHQVAPLTALVEQHEHTARLAAARHVARVGAVELGEHKLAVGIFAGAPQHGGAESHAREREHCVGRLAAAGTLRLHVEQRLLQRLALLGRHHRLRTGWPQLAPQGEGVGQPVDEVEVEGAAADEVVRLHRQSDPR